MVSVGVSVRENGRPVVGLTADDFEIRDEGVVQEIAGISYEKLPIDVTVALDVSESVTGELLDRLRYAVAQLSTDLAEDDRLRLLTFNARIRRVLDFDDDRARATEALEQAAAEGGTALLDTLAVALMAPISRDRRHLILVFSDGLDTASVTNRATVLDLVRQSGATAAFVLPASGFVGGSSPAGRFYEEVASETGGQVVPMQARDDLGPTFRRVLSEFRSSYVLHFTPRGVRQGGVHDLDVRVSRSGVDVRARRGYGAQ
jgi:VWFA-related protein